MNYRNGNGKARKHREYGNFEDEHLFALIGFNCSSKACIGFTSSPLTEMNAKGKAMDFC